MSKPNLRPNLIQGFFFLPHFKLRKEEHPPTTAKDKHFLIKETFISMEKVTKLQNNKHNTTSLLEAVIRFITEHNNI